MSKYKEKWGQKIITVSVDIGTLRVVKKASKNTLTRYQEKLTQNFKRLPPRIKPHPPESSIARIKTMTFHWGPKTLIGSGVNGEHDKRIKKNQR